MTIDRRIDWFGKIVRNTNPLPGSGETLVCRIDNLLAVGVESEDKLAVVQGKFVVDPNSFKTYPPKYKPSLGPTIILTREAINKFTIQGSRNWLGFRVSYKWRPSLDDLDLFSESFPPMHPTFSK